MKFKLSLWDYHDKLVIRRYSNDRAGYGYEYVIPTIELVMDRNM